MKIAISIGHTLRGADTGAVGYLNESNCTREIGDYAKQYLENAGHEVVLCRIDNASSVMESLRYKVNLANENYVDMFAEIHLNAGGGNGVEVYVCGLGGSAEQYARNVLNNIVALGYTNRGVKTANHYVTKNTNAPAILVECCFVDSVGDAERYSAQDLGKAIAEGIVGQTINNIVEETPVTQPIIETQQTSDIQSNATIINDFLYVRDSEGNVINGRVDIGDNVQVLDISYSSQLVLMKYPTSNGSRTEYVKNATSCISYEYEYQWQNGSTEEPVYQDSDCNYQIGTLNPYEKATPLYRKDGVLHVAYDTNKGNHTKSGYVKYDGGFNQF